MKGGDKRGLIIFGVIFFIIIVAIIIIVIVDPFDWRCQKKTESCKDVEDCCGKELKCIDKKCSKPEPTPEPPTPPTPKECVGDPIGTFCEDEPETRKCWPHCPDPSQWGKPAVYNCGNKYDKTSGKQCKYGWGKNYRIGGDSESFGCLSGDSCKVL